MSYDSVFDLIYEITQRTKIKSILIGGYALNCYKVTRQTADVDFLLTMDSFKKIEDLLLDEDFTITDQQDCFIRLRSSQQYLMDLDFMLVDEKTHQKIYKDGTEIKIAGIIFRIPSMQHLIALKLHAIKNNSKNRMYKDFPDIINLIRINEMDVFTPEFEELCRKHGPPGILQKIRETL